MSDGTGGRTGARLRAGRRARVGADADPLERARRTAAVVVGGGGWVWPHWLERQLDPGSAAFVPLGSPPLVRNLTGRSWTSIGAVDSPFEAVVDRRGLVTPRLGGWSLDWWVGAEDRWHLPSREAAVRQRLVEDAPVVETAMRVPGGDVLHRAYVVRAAPVDGGGELVVVEVENATPVPVALALSVRPADVEGVTAVHRIALDLASGDPVTVLVDGQPALLLPRPPNRSAGSTGRDGDVATTVLSGAAGETFPGDLRCPDGLATAAFVVPLAHRATLRVLLPLGGAPAVRGRRSATGPRPVAPAALASASQVANGWRAHAAQGMRLVLPDARLAAVVEASRRSLLVAHDRPLAGTRDGADPGASAVERARVLGALVRLGHGREVDAVLAALPGAQRGDGSFPGGRPLVATGAALHALAERRRMTGGGGEPAALAPVVAAAAERLGRAAADGGGATRTAVDAPWVLRGLLDAAELLDAAAEHDAANAARGAARRAQQLLDAGASADERLLACWPLRILDAGGADVAAAAAEVRDGRDHDGTVTEPDGWSPAATLRLAAVELASGEARALDRLDRVLAAASPTTTWPTTVHPRLDTGSSGDGHDATVTADLVTFVRDLLVREDGPGGLALCSLLPPTWLGQPLEVHDAPTHHGTISFAVRWHGDRPALLWERTPHDGQDAVVTITAPGLDPGWSTTELRGDALLAPVPPPPELAAEPEPAPEPDVATPVQLTKRPRG